MKTLIHGFFEEVITHADPVKCLGVRDIKWDGQRKFGFAGEQRLTLHGDIYLRRGHRDCVRIKIRKPVVVNTYIHPVCGRRLPEQFVTNHCYMDDNGKIHNLDKL
jgi:hypothetical protein